MEGEAHKLFTEPDLYVRTLAQVTLMEMPRFIEYMGRLRAISSGAIEKGGLSEEDKKLILGYLEEIVSYRKSLHWILENITLPQETIIMFRNAQDLLNMFMSTFNEYFAKDFKVKGLRGTEFFKSATSVIDGFIESHKVLLYTSLKIIKNKKISYFKRLTLLLSGLSFVFILTTLGFYVSYRYIISKLKAISEGVKRITEGDHAYRITLEGKDEIAETVKVLNQSLDEIFFLTFYDKVSSAPNRQKLLLDIQKFSHPVFILIDINFFGDINSIYGYKAGDKILKELYQRLKEAFKSEAYRVGADEFAVVFEFPEKEKEVSEILTKEIKNRLESLIKSPFLLDGENILLNFTAVAICESVEGERLLTDAYTLLNEAKARNESFLYEYEPEERFRKLHEESLFWLKKFRKALEEDRIVPYYQPIFDNKTRKPVKFEALVRLIDENGEVVSPFRFLSVAQKAGYGPRLTQIMLNKVISDFRFLPFEVSVNLSYRDFLSEELLSFIEKALDEDISSRLVFEFLETEEIGNPELVFSKLKEFKKKGVKIAIDDFGSGYSNLQRIIELKVDYIKIDASLIKKLPQDEKVYSLVKAIVSFAKEAGIKTIAEFVADEEIYQKVCEVGIDYSQGYYFSPPLPLKDLKAFLS